MTPSNNQIMSALFTRLTDAELGYQTSWPGVKFTPPDSGVWLEVMFQPNSHIDNGLGYDDDYVPRGMMTVMVMTRPGIGITQVQDAADEVIATFPKGAALSGLVRIIRTPWQFDISQQPDRLGVAVTVEYSG